MFLPIPNPAINLAACVAIGLMGRHYRFGFWGYFFASLLLSPPIGVICLLAAGRPDRVASPSAVDYRRLER